MTIVPQPGALRLYRIPFSTNVERVSLALAHKGLTAESVWVDPGDRADVVRVSGQPLVPVLGAAGEVLHDSTRILQWLELHYPEPPLYPRDRARRAELDVFVEWFNSVWKGPPNEIEAELACSRPNDARIAELGTWLRGSLTVFESLLAGRNHLFADDFSAADCVAFPFLKYALLHDPADDELFHRILAEHLPLRPGHAGLRAWIHRVDQRPRV